MAIKQSGRDKFIDQVGALIYQKVLTHLDQNDGFNGFINDLIIMPTSDSDIEGALANAQQTIEALEFALANKSFEIMMGNCGLDESLSPYIYFMVLVDPYFESHHAWDFSSFDFLMTPHNHEISNIRCRVTAKDMALNPRYIDPAEDDPSWQYWTDLMLESIIAN